MVCYNTVLLDDDPLANDVLRSALLVSDYAEMLSLRTVSSVEELTQVASQEQPIDILFADIHLDGTQGAGIKAVAELFPRGSRTQVIYISGYLEQATEVYETQHIYFLSKPVDQAKLRAALGQAIAALEQQQSRWLQVTVGKSTVKVGTANILCIESNLRKAVIHLADKPDPVTVYGKLDDLQQQLPDAFVRCHGSFIVNLAHITELGATSCVLDDGTSVPISRARSESVKQAFAGYLRRAL